MHKIKAIILPIIIYILIFIPFGIHAQEVRDIRFPIEDGWDYNFTDTYGAPRSGGRTHIGTDIMVEQMTPLLAAVDGRVSYLVENDRGWGLAIYIEDADGYSYRYLHVNNDTPGTNDNKEIRAYAFPRDIMRGSVVSAGQIIAFAGNSGNAEYVAHHLHFEIWTPDRQSINPYPSLMAAIGRPIEKPSIEIENISAYYFSRDLQLGSTGEDVRELQKYLNQNGFIVASSGVGSPGNETTYFGTATQAALIRFQQAKGIAPAAGYFGAITRAFINNNQSQSMDENSDPSSPDIVRAGWLVKDKLSPRVYHVAANLELQWIVSEEAAIRNFGSEWYLQIRELADLENSGLFFGDYVL